MFTGGYRSRASLMRPSIRVSDGTVQEARNEGREEVAYALTQNTPSRLSAFLFRIYNQKLQQRTKGEEMMM